MAKANPIASSSPDIAMFPDSAVLLDGQGVTPDAGGVVMAGNEFYSLSTPELVSGGQEAADRGDILMRRTGRITIASYATSQPTSYGGEAEYFVVDQSGNYSQAMGCDIELYNTIVETNTGVAHDPDELHDEYARMAQATASQAEAKGVLLAPVSVMGQRDARPDEVSQHPYVTHTIRTMEEVTGFRPADIFRVCGVQPHTRISNLPAALQAGEAMQLLTPILASPSLSAPFLLGGAAAKLASAEHTPQQQYHLTKAGITPEDLRGPYLSHRYLLRRAGSPSAGIWTEPAPDSVEEYLRDGHEKLRSGQVNNIDRFRGWHADRVRAVLDGSDATTFEGCSYDTFAGNITAITDNHLLYSAVFTALEAKAMRGDNVIEEVARELGISHMNRTQRLHAAHRAMLAVSRYSNDAQIYGQRPQDWLLSSLLDLADEAPHTRLNLDRRLRLLSNFATMDQTVPAVLDWRRRNPSTPLMQFYHQTGLNAPAVYMQSSYNARAGTPEERVRHVELEVAKTFHAHVGELALQK